MPTVLRVEGYRFFFFSNEGTEPAHIHVERGDGYAKFWLDPVELAEAKDLTSPELKHARLLVTQYQAQFMEKWHEHFGT